MQKNVFLLALGAGIVSAVVFASATTGPLLLRVVLFLLTPLSLYLSGLGLGVIAVTIAGITATAAVLLMAGPLAAAVYAISTAFPAAYLTRLALMSRTDGETRVWYPLGDIVVYAAGFASLFAVLAIVLMGNDIDALQKMMRTLVENFAKNDLAQIPGAPKIESGQIDEIAKSTLLSLPWALAILSLSTMLLNLWLAGRITLASGSLVRPWPDLSMLTLPPRATFAILIAVALTFAGGMMGLFASALAAPLTFAFALVGLAVVHYLTRGSPWRNFILAALYAGTFFVPHVMPLLAIAGLAETIFHYRAALPGGPPDTAT